MIERSITNLRNPKVLGQIRHFLTAAGPLLVHHGVTTEAYWAMLVGLAMAALGFIASWTAPEKKHE